MRPSARRIAKWCSGALATIVVLLALDLSVLFLPHPLFPHHLEHAGFSAYSDRAIPKEFDLVLEDARRRVEAMPLYRGGTLPRVFVCRSQRRFAFLVRMAGKRHAGQGLLISAAGNLFLSEHGIEAVARRHHGKPARSRLEGSWPAAIAHEVAHHLVFAELGFARARRIPAWKSEGYADYAANLASAASDPDDDLRRRIELVQDDRLWQQPAGATDRRHFRWQVTVEYLCTVRGLDLSHLLADEVTEAGAWAEAQAWNDRP